jgi:16S rRNA processing protein RimM
MDRERVVLAEILRPRGNRGEVVARSQTDIPGRLESLKLAHVRLADGSDIPVEIVEAWEHKEDWVLRFSGVESIDAADKFRGADLWVSAAERAILPAGDFFQSDLIGCTVVDQATGNRLGVVEGWQQYGGPPLIELTANGREVLIPFVAAECQVDLASREIRANVPIGILEI